MTQNCHNMPERSSIGSCSSQTFFRSCGVEAPASVMRCTCPVMSGAVIGSTVGSRASEKFSR